jgi:hypothetical protein
VAMVQQLLGLDVCKESPVGDEAVRGISGGQVGVWCVYMCVCVLCVCTRVCVCAYVYMGLNVCKESPVGDKAVRGISGGQVRVCTYTCVCTCVCARACLCVRARVHLWCVPRGLEPSRAPS